MNKKYLFSSLLAILINFSLFSTDQKRLEEIHTHYNASQTIISNNTTHDINLLHNEIKQLKIKKQNLENLYNKLITPALYTTGSIILGSLTLLDIALHLLVCIKADTLKTYDMLIEEAKKGHKIPIIFLVSPFLAIATGISCKKLFTATWNHKQQRTKKLQEIETAITRNQTIIAQLQQQTKLKENNA